MRAWVALLLVAGCATEAKYRVAPGPLQFSKEPENWIGVHEPGWFTAAFPSTPKASIEPAQVHIAFDYKVLRSATSTVGCSIRYVEFSSAADAQVDRYVINESHGATSVNMSGLEGKETQTELAPRTAINETATPILVRTRVVADGLRIYEFQCSAPAKKALECERFFMNFQPEHP